MKCFVSILLTLMVFGLAYDIQAQSKKTIILVRHAEKDVSESADKRDPALSPEGVRRAELLRDKIKKYKPGAVFSTNYKRTMMTVDPIAKRRKKTIQTYDPQAQQKLVDEIINSKTKRFVVAGHSNTVPLLANLIINKEIFKPLDESEYATIWVIRLNKGKPAKVELLSY